MYAALTERYNATKEKYDKATEQIEAKKAQRELIKGFVRTLEEHRECCRGVRCRDVVWIGRPCDGDDKDNIVFTFRMG